MGKITLEPYLSSNGNCQAAIDLYTKIFNGTTDALMRFSDMPPTDSEFLKFDGNQIMHAVIRMGDKTLMMSDDPTGEYASGNNITLNYSTDDEEEAKRIFAEFEANGALITMPLASTFFTKLFGALLDPFGVPWQIMYWSDEENKTE